MKTAVFLFHRKLLKINLAVLHYFYASKTWVGEQFPAGVARFVMTWEFARNIFYLRQKRGASERDFGKALSGMTARGARPTDYLFFGVPKTQISFAPQ